MSTVDELDFLPEEKPKNTEQTPIFTPGTIMLIVGVIAVTVVLALQLFNQNAERPGPGATAPTFSLTTYDGEAYTLEDLQGQVVVLNIWANWCPPCHDEAPDFQNIWEDYQDKGVVLIGANYLEVDSVALQFIDQYNITYPNGSDVRQQIAEAYQFEGPPETFIIDQEGKVVQYWLGSVDYDTLAGVLDELIGDDA